MNFESFKKENQEYIQTKVNPFFESLLYDLLLNKPEDIVEFSTTWLKTNGAKIKALTRRSVSASTKKNENSAKKVVPTSSDEDEDDDVEDLPLQKKSTVSKKNQRSSVSAEAYGNFNKKGAFKARVINKSDEQKKRIKERLCKAFMFQALDEKESEIVINAMEEKRFRSKEFVIRQGEDGDQLYVVDSGQLDCYKRFKPSENDRYLKTYQPGESFGELALLYNAPRAATIIAKTESVLFALDRECFNNIVKDSAVKRREKYEDFLGKVDLLSSMDPYEKTQLADVLKTVRFRKGNHVITQGDPGDAFYMVEEGELYAEKVAKSGEAPEIVMQYKAGDYFGELALLNEIPRQASVVCKTDCVIGTLDKMSFKRLLGPVEEILKRNQAKYAKYKR